MSRRETYTLVFCYNCRERRMMMLYDGSTYDDAFKQIEECKGRLAEGERYFNSRIIKKTSEVVYEDGNDEYAQCKLATCQESRQVGDAAKHRFREVTKTIPREEVVVAKMETTTPTYKDSLQVGNAAKYKDALSKIAYIVRMFDDIDNVRRRMKAVLENLKAQEGGAE